MDRVAQRLAIGDTDGAAALTASYAATDPGAHELGRAALALHRRDTSTALQHVHRALAHGGGAVAHSYAAMAHLMAGDADAAVDHARKAVALDGSVRNRSSLGGVMLAVGRPADAAAVLKQVIAEHPRDHDALLNLATASSQLQDHGEAITYYARAFDVDPTDQRPIQNMLHMFAELGKWMGAVAALELSRKGDPPTDVAVALDLVMVHLVRLISVKFPKPGTAEDADEAVGNLITHAQQRAPKTQLIAARTLVDFGRFDDAHRVMQRLAKIQLDDDDRANLAYLEGVIAEQARDRDAALAHYERALAGDPARSDAATNAISMLLEDGSPAALDRIGALVGAVDARAKHASASLLFNEAIYLTRIGRSADARTNLERMLQLTGGEGPMANMARQALADLGRAS
ncbi:MAG TPA: tetratricopeptide repeat protein [Kofleriaceae bacterium]|nr:tetratricopeptide repeat protein [Kofleriaceae bacterium]